MDKRHIYIPNLSHRQATKPSSISSMLLNKLTVRASTCFLFAPLKTTITTRTFSVFSLLNHENPLVHVRLYTFTFHHFTHADFSPLRAFPENPQERHHLLHHQMFLGPCVDCLRSGMSEEWSTSLLWRPAKEVWENRQQPVKKTILWHPYGKTLGRKWYLM